MNKLGILEGLLFVVGEDGLTKDELLKILEIEENELVDFINQLEKRYNSDTSGIKLKLLGNSYKLTTKEEHHEYYEKLIHDEQSNGLSQAALETLVIIAYNEPITRIEVDEARGIYSAPMIRKLVTKGLVEMCGKTDLPGRPNLYKTTNLFLDYFGLSSIEDLPKIETEETIEENKDLFKSKYMEEVE